VIKTVGVILILSAIPIIYDIIKLTLLSNSSDKQKTNLTIKLYSILSALILVLLSTAFFWIVFFTTNYDENKFNFLLISVSGTAITIAFSIWLYFVLKKYRKS